MMAITTRSAPMSAAQIGDLALDAAIEIDRFIAKEIVDLGSARFLLESLAHSLHTGALDGSGSSKIELSFLPIYEQAVALQGEVPETVDAFSTRVLNVFEGFRAAEHHRDETLLPGLRDFCLAVHEQVLSERLDVIAATQPTMRRGSTAY